MWFNMSHFHLEKVPRLKSNTHYSQHNYGAILTIMSPQPDLICFSFVAPGSSFMVMEYQIIYHLQESCEITKWTRRTFTVAVCLLSRPVGCWLYFLVWHSRSDLPLEEVCWTISLTCLFPPSLLIITQIGSRLYIFNWAICMYIYSKWLSLFVKWRSGCSNQVY